MEEEECGGGDAGGEVAEHHDVFSVPSVDDGAREGAGENLGDRGEEGDEGEGGGFPGGLPRPDGDGELGHAGSEEGDELAEPDDGEALHAGGAPGLGLLGCAVVSVFGVGHLDGSTNVRVLISPLQGVGFAKSFLQEGLPMFLCVAAVV